MGAMWRFLRDAVTEKASGMLRREIAYVPTDAFVAALKSELRRALLWQTPTCPHGHLMAIDSFDLHWGSAEVEHPMFVTGLDKPNISVRYVCRHDFTDGTFSPAERFVVIERPIAEPAERAQLDAERKQLARTIQNDQRELNEALRRNTEQQIRGSKGGDGGS